MTDSTPTPAQTWLLLAGLVLDNRSSWRTVVTELIEMPFSRFRALRRLEARSMSGAELAESLGVDRPAASVIVRDLLARGLLVQDHDPADRRRRIMQITGAGREVMDLIRERAEPVPLVGALDEQERATLHGLLTKMHEAIGERGDPVNGAIGERGDR